MYEDLGKNLIEYRSRIMWCIKRRLELYRGNDLYFRYADDPDIDDIYQETCLAMFKKWDSYDNSRPFLSWAWGMARMQVRKFLLEHKREKLMFTPGWEELHVPIISNPIEDDIKREKMLCAIEDGLQVINPKLSGILTLKYYDRIKSKQIAEKLETTESAIEMCLTRGRHELRDYVANFSWKRVTLRDRKYMIWV